MINSNFIISEINDLHIPRVVELWNKTCNKNFLYKPFKEETFKEKFVDSSYFRCSRNYVCLLNNEVVGFANGVYRKELLPGEKYEDIPGYITIIIVKDDKKGLGIGRALVEKLEKYLKNEGKNKVRVDFFNPTSLPWYIPNSLRHDHPNAPGVDIEGEGYEFFKKLGYIERTKEVSMYRTLKEFVLGERIKEREEELNKNGIVIQYYNKSKHYGLEEFFHNLKNEYWRKDIFNNLSLEKPYPFFIAAHNGKVCGFAGPLQVEKSGRGLFCGIGVEPNYEGKGIGKLLFFKLCEGFKKEGAEFMSLFTDINGNARKMYADAGFKVIRTWALFEREV
ncbi:GNAT family N-acetyltransferase [Clostridium lundense]|uniref:GNAT family N-acetyltransferase n=1 Tax=Clostridium lundense TaxID=319475 RepID=UPI000483DF9D|nr:GNAT family N-acetyltransferase [Clostridium lundense]